MKLKSVLITGFLIGASAFAMQALTKGDLNTRAKGGHSKFEFSATMASQDGVAKPLDCYNATPTELNRELSVQLCASAHSSGPAECYKASPADLSPEDSVKLCRYAKSYGPADCYMKSPIDLTREQTIALCQERQN